MRTVIRASISWPGRALGREHPSRPASHLLRSAALAACTLGVACSPATPPSPPAPLVGGIQVNEPILGRWLGAVGSAGLNTVATTAYAKQGDWDSARLWSDAELAPVADEITQARRAGLRTVLILRVALDHAYERNRFLWHGMISPRTEADVDRWFDAYTEFVVRWARMAEARSVDVLGIGSELDRLAATRPVSRRPALEAWYLDREKQAEFQRRVLSFGDRITGRHRATLGGGHFADNAAFLAARSARWRQWAEVVAFAGRPDAIAEINRRRRHLENRWRQLIARVRTVYHGRLTYAANFDTYREVGFWDALDVIGINAYFELRSDLSRARLDARLLAAWQRVFRDIEAFRRERGLRANVLFTELGYTWRRHSTVKPWAQSGFTIIDGDLLIWEDQPPAPHERAKALDALHRVAYCAHPGLLAGVLYWKLSSWPDQRAVEPFVLVLNQQDPAQAALARFVKPECRPARR